LTEHQAEFIISINTEQEVTIMSANRSDITIRPMEFLDLRAIFEIHKKIEAEEKYPTYKQFHARKIFGMGAEENTPRPDILEVAKLIDLGMVAESEGKICGFALGRERYLAEHDIHEGEIAIIGVDPDCRKSGVARKLIDAICDLLESRGVNSVRIGIDPEDENLLAFFERVGFTGQRLLYLSKAL
jgi:ribosomal protein S18 acetylase RimI-like enzyme